MRVSVHGMNVMNGGGATTVTPTQRVSRWLGGSPQASPLQTYPACISEREARDGKCHQHSSHEPQETTIIKTSIKLYSSSELKAVPHSVGHVTSRFRRV